MSDLAPKIIIQFNNGFYISETVCWCVIVVIALLIFCLLSARNLKRDPKGSRPWPS